MGPEAIPAENHWSKLGLIWTTEPSLKNWTKAKTEVYQDWARGLNKDLTKTESGQIQD